MYLITLEVFLLFLHTLLFLKSKVGFSNSKDVFSKSLYIRQRDLFRISFEDILFMNGQSINFFCEDPGVTYPGIQIDDYSSTAAQKKDFESANLITYDNYIFVTSNKGEKFDFFRVKENNIDLELIVNYDLSKILYKKKDSSAKTSWIKTNGHNKILAMITLPPERVVLLMGNLAAEAEDRTRNTYEYQLIFYNFAKNKLESEISILGPYFDFPKLVFYSPKTNLKNNLHNLFIVFNQDDHSEGRFETVKKITLYMASIKNGIMETTSSRNVLIYEIIPKLANIYIRLMNVVISQGATENQTLAFFFIKKLDENNLIRYEVYSCSLHFSEKIENIKFENCDIFIEKNLKYVVLADSVYITVEKTRDNKEVINFCTISNEYCKGGIIDSGWEIEEVRIEGIYGFVLIKISGVSVIIINNFVSNQMVYFYADMVGVKEVFLQQQIIDGKPRLFLIKMFPHEFTRKDITINFKTIIEGIDIKDLNPIEIKLENEIVESLDLNLWDGESIIDRFRGIPIPVVRLPEGTFRVKIGAAGSNMNFKVNQNSGVVFYFNLCQIIFTKPSLKLESSSIAISNKTKNIRRTTRRLNAEKDKNPETSEPFLIYTKFHFYANKIVKNDCQFDTFVMVVNCIATSVVFLENPINITKITEFLEYGDFILITGWTSDDILFYDKTLNEIVDIDIPERFKGLLYCFTAIEFIYCEAINNPNNIDTIRLFKLEKQKLVEIETFEKDLIKAVEEQIISTISDEVETVPKITLSDSGFDTVRFNRFYVIYHVQINGVYNTFILKMKLRIESLQKEGQTLSFSRRMYSEEKNENLNKDMEIYVLDSQILFIRKKPRFMMWLASQGSYSNFEFIDMQKIIKIMVNPVYNIVVFVYQHHEDSEYYFAIYYITVNSIKQLIRNEKIGKFSQYFRLTIYPITTEIIVFIQYNYVTNEVYNSYMFFLNGPFLQHTSTKESIVIDDKQFFPLFYDDGDFNTNYVRYIHEKTIFLDKFQNSKKVDLTNYINISGNIKDINIIGSYASKSQIKMTKPLTFETDEILDLCLADCNEGLFKYDGVIVIYQLDHSSTEFFVKPIIDRLERHSIKFNLEPGHRCIEILNADKYLICFWSYQSRHHAIIRPLSKSDQTPSVEFVIPYMVINPTLIYCRDNYLLITYIDADRRFVGIYNFEWESPEEKDLTTDFIGSKELLTSDVHVSQYIAFGHLESELFYVIILDSWANQLFFYKANLFALIELPTLKNSVSLNDLDLVFYHFDCDFNENMIIFNCFLFSGNYIYKANITLSPDTIVSDYKWVFKTSMHSYNVLYETVLDNSFDIDIDIKGNEFFLYEKNPIEELKKQIIYYNVGLKNSLYSHYLYDMKSHSDILLIKFEKDINEISIFDIVENNLRHTRLKIDEYRIEINGISNQPIDESQKEGKNTQLRKNQIVLQDDLEIEILFVNNHRHNMKFNFEFNGLNQEKSKNGRINWSSVFIFATVIMCVLVFSLGLSLIILLNKKSRYEKKFAALENEENEVDSLIAESESQSVISSLE